LQHLANDRGYVAGFWFRLFLASLFALIALFALVIILLDYNGDNTYQQVASAIYAIASAIGDNDTHFYRYDPVFVLDYKLASAFLGVMVSIVVMLLFYPHDRAHHINALMPRSLFSSPEDYDYRCAFCVKDDLILRHPHIDPAFWSKAIMLVVDKPHTVNSFSDLSKRVATMYENLVPASSDEDKLEHRMLFNLAFSDLIRIATNNIAFIADASNNATYIKKFFLTGETSAHRTPFPKV
jgi:hypothetical protein